MIDLDAIRERDAEVERFPYRNPIPDGQQAMQDRRALLAEVDVLTRERDSAREALRVSEQHVREQGAHIDSLQNRWASRPLSHPDGEALVKENQDLRDTLELLVDYQNGCPLPSYEEQWTRAMQAAARLLGRSPPQNPCQP